MKKWLVIAAAAVVAGCGSTVTGTAEPGSTAVDINLLRTGPFQTVPKSFEFETSANGPEMIKLIEGRRLLNYLVHPMDLDPSLVFPRQTFAFADGSDVPISGALRDEHKYVFRNNVNFITGVVATQSNGSVRNPKEISVAILQFSSEAESAKSVQELHQITLESTNARVIDIPESPITYATASDDKAIDTWKVHGPYLIMTSVRISSPDLNQLVSSVKKSLEMQTHSLDGQRPTPLDDVLDQPLDPENMLRRALARDKRDLVGSTGEFGVLKPSAMLHYERHPAEARQKFEETGVDLIARRTSTVYRTRDLGSAFVLQNFLSKKGKNDIEMTPPPGIADAQCLRMDERDPHRNYDVMCAVVYDRYVAVVTESSLNATAQIDHTLQERTAAQYVILKKCA